MSTAQQHELEGAYKRAEIDALEAQHAASILEARALHAEKYGEPMVALSLCNQAEVALNTVAILEGRAWQKYQAWADTVR